MSERQHGMYYTPDQFTQESSQMSPLYTYPYQRYVTVDLFGSPSPAGTLSFAHGCQISMPNAPMGPPWSVSGNIPNITDLLGVMNFLLRLMKGGAIGEGIQIAKLGDGSDHVGQHVWNGELDRNLHIRRAVPIYQGQEEILEEIIPLLRQSGFYWIMTMGYLKINSSLITALIERWKPETHTFHMRCEECTIILQDVSVLLGLRVDGAPLIDQTNLDWAELCEELLGVRPQEGELQGSVVKLSWLAHHFSQINIHDGNVEQLQRFTRAWILRFIGGVLFVDKSSSKVSLRYLQFLRDFEQCSMYAWGPAVLAYLYREMCSATDYKIKSIGDMWLQRGNQHIGNDDLIFLWEPYTTTVMSALPPICLVGSVAWCAVVPLICFHVVEWHQPDRVL
ncbi:Serine/threonine-protein phosphatase 7 long form [Glycine max]|nr:Serine/threonine-protein phosphatase 7 long form [Glycine max]